jgi:hypothetical protein
MAELGGAIHKFVNVAFEKQTYMNILYLLFSFPLGTAYFIFLVSGLSFGFSLLIFWVGIPVLLLILVAWWEIAAFERQMAVWLLGVEIPSMYPASFSNSNILQRFMQRVTSPVTWKALIFLLIKFPLGVFSLVLMTVLLSLTLTMLFTPVFYALGIGEVSSVSQAIFISASGIFVGFVSLHLLNLLAAVSGDFAKRMLGKSEKQAK